jgi:hypothetical protein
MALLDLQSLELSGRDRDHDCGCDDNDGSFLSFLLCSH